MCSDYRHRRADIEAWLTQPVNKACAAVGVGLVTAVRFQPRAPRSARRAAMLKEFARCAFSQAGDLIFYTQKVHIHEDQTRAGIGRYQADCSGR